MPVSFTDATRVTPISSHTYAAHFPDDWCIGSVPHGGFVTSVFLAAARTHFATTLATQNQPHTIALHLEFLRRTQVGLATFTIKDAKLGRQASVIHVSLQQDGREEVAGYITNSNLDTEDGVTLATGWDLHPPPPAMRSVAELATGNEPEWAEQTAMPFAGFRKAGQRMRFFFPRKGQLDRSLRDEWLTFRSGERFTNDSLGLVCDMWPQIVEAYGADEDPYTVTKEGAERVRRREREGKGWSRSWYPTLLLNLDVKKALPVEGVEWLFVRVRAKTIRNGRYDLEVVILDEAGEVVALSHHVALVLGAERNLAQRRKEGAKI